MKSKIFLFLCLIISSSENIVEQTNDNDFFASLISVFDNEALLKNWINFGDTKNETAVNLLKEIIVKLKDILTVIDKPEYEDLKKLIVDTKTSFPDEIAHPYFETYIISESICRILKLHDLFKELEDDSCYIDEMCQFKSETNLIKSFKISKATELYYKIVLSEYESIYSVIVKDIFLVVSYHLQEDYLYLRKLLANKQTELLFNETVWVFVRHFFKYSRDMLDEILVVDNTGHTYILVSKDGMTFSQKCFLNMSNNYLKNELKILFTVQQVQEFENIYSSYDETRYLTMKKYIDKRYVCNKALTKLLISLIHFYTMRTGENTKYVIDLNKEGFYETKWSSSKAFD